MKFKRITPLVVSMASVLLVSSVSAQTADTTNSIQSRSEIISLMRKVCDYQTSNAQGISNGWIRSAFYTGLMATYHATGDEKYLSQAIRWGEESNWTPAPSDPRHADNQCCGQTYCELYLLKKDPKMIQPFRLAVDQMMASPKPGRVDWWWCDALFMAPTAITRLAAATGEAKYNAFMNEMWWDSTDFLFDKQEQLYYRDKNYFDAKTKNGKKVFWSRGNGWVFAGIARVLQYLPEQDPNRGRFIELFRQMAAKLASIQGADGLWRSSLLDPEEFPMPEASGSGFFTFGLAWGVNQGILEREKYLAVVMKAWKGLQSVVNSEGRVGYVQQVAGSPGPSKPEGTQEYAVGAFLLAANEMLQFAPTSDVKKPGNVRLDFGAAATEKGYVPVRPNTNYQPDTGFGWLNPPGDIVLRDRRAPDALRRDYVFGHSPASFRVDLAPGTYQMTLIMGDMDYGNHVLQTSVDVEGVELPVLRAKEAEFATLTAAFNVSKDHVVLRFASPENNWIVNALSFESTSSLAKPQVTHAAVAQGPQKVKDAWSDVSKWPDPMASHVKRFRENLAKAAPVTPTGLSRQDYLKVIQGNVDYFRNFQNAEGAIIDPHKKNEWQYSTPCFALAAATLIAHADRKDLVEPAAKAMDWSCHSLKLRKGATNHEDFYPPQLAHALPILKPLVSAKRAAKWESDLKSFDPFQVYRSRPGGRQLERRGAKRRVSFL